MDTLKYPLGLLTGILFVAAAVWVNDTLNVRDEGQAIQHTQAASDDLRDSMRAWVDSYLRQKETAQRSAPDSQRAGRYRLVRLGDIRADTYLLDTVEGRVWQWVKFTDVAGEPQAWNYTERLDTREHVVRFALEHDVAADRAEKLAAASDIMDQTSDALLEAIEAYQAVDPTDAEALEKAGQAMEKAQEAHTEALDEFIPAALGDAETAESDASITTSMDSDAALSKEDLEMMDKVLEEMDKIY